MWAARAWHYVAYVQGFMQQVKALPPPETKQEREAKLELAAQQSAGAAIPAPAVEDEDDVELPELEMDPEVRALPPCAERCLPEARMLARHLGLAGQINGRPGRLLDDACFW